MKNKRKIPMRRYSKAFRLLVTSFAAILIIPVIAALLTGTYALQASSIQTKESYISLVEQMAREVDLVFQDSTLVNYKIAENSLIQSYALREDRSFYTEYELRQEILKTKLGYDSVENCYIYFPKFDCVVYGGYVTNSEDFYNRNYTGSYESWLEMMDIETSLSYIDALPAKQTNFVVYKRVSNELDGKDAIAVTQINNDYLKTRLRFNDSSNGVHVLLTKGASYLSSSDEETTEILNKAFTEGREKIRIDGVSYQLLSAESSINSFNVIYAIPSSLINSSGRFAWKYASLLIGICLIITLILGYYLARKNYKPVQNIYSLIEKDIQESFTDEYEAIEEALQGYMQKNDDLTKTCMQSGVQLKKLYLEKLLLSNIPNVQTIPETCKLYDITFPHEYYCVVMFALHEDSILFKDNSLDEKERDVLTQLIIENIITELYSEFCTVYFTSTDGFPVAICNVGKENLKTIKNSLEEATQKALSAIGQHFYILFRPFTSDLYEGVGKIGTAYQEVRQMMNKSDEEGHGLNVSERVYANCIEKCINFIHENYADSNLSLDTVAEAVELNSSYLSRYFKQQTGLGLLEYLQRYRLSMAKKLIRENHEMLLKDVAEQSGFYNSAGLIRVFKKFDNTTPGKYRDSLFEQMP